MSLVSKNLNITELMKMNVMAVHATNSKMNPQSIANHAMSSTIPHVLIWMEMKFKVLSGSLKCGGAQDVKLKASLWCGKQAVIEDKTTLHFVYFCEFLIIPLFENKATFLSPIN
eukprot:103434_1